MLPCLVFLSISRMIKVMYQLCVLMLDENTFYSPALPATRYPVVIKRSWVGIPAGSWFMYTCTCITNLVSSDCMTTKCFNYIERVEKELENTQCGHCLAYPKATCS